MHGLPNRNTQKIRASLAHALAGVMAMLLCTLMAAEASGLAFLTVPDVLRPGKLYEIIIDALPDRNPQLTLHTPEGEEIFALAADDAYGGEGIRYVWDGTDGDGRIIPEGEYTLRLTDGGELVPWPLRIGAPYPFLSQFTQSDHVLMNASLAVSYVASGAGILSITLKDEGGHVTPLYEGGISAGYGRYEWELQVGGQRVPEGHYSLVFQLKAANGASSMPAVAKVEVVAPDAQAVSDLETENGEALLDADIPSDESMPEITLTDTGSTLPEAEMAVDPLNLAENPPDEPGISPPYSSVKDYTFWGMNPGETDDARLWEILMQPIIVYDGGIKAGTKGHAYMMENPDGSGRKVAQLHTQSQGVHVIGQENEYGYILVEAFGNYDREYYPETEEEIARAFELKQGYVLAKDLKTVEVMPDMALLVDKLTQRMYLFKDGVRVTEFLISTGTYTSNKDLLFETVAGEFITVSHAGGFWSGNMYCDMSIRINGGILLHEVPCKINADNTRNYSSFEGYLGTKQSHGCIRIQRLKTDEGYNHRWLWDNLKRGQPYKVIIWDDRNRADTPTTWQPNPKN